MVHDTSHVRRLAGLQAARQAPKSSARELAAELQRNKAIMGVFDEGCMGMYNAIIPDELLHPTGVFKERLSQSALYAEMQRSAMPKRRQCAPGSTARACASRPGRTRRPT